MPLALHWAFCAPPCCACRDLTIPPVGTATGTHVAVAGLREAVSQLEVPTPGEACVIRCAALRAWQAGYGRGAVGRPCRRACH